MTNVEKERICKLLAEQILPAARHKAMVEGVANVDDYVAAIITEWIDGEFVRKPSINEELGILGE